jgi:hypothetical protein
MADLKKIAEEALALAGKAHLGLAEVSGLDYLRFLAEHGEALARGVLDLTRELGELKSTHLALLAERDRLREALEDARQRWHDVQLKLGSWEMRRFARESWSKVDAALAQPPKPEPAEGT